MVLSVTEQILTTNMSSEWDSYETSKLLTASEASLIKAYDRAKNASERVHMLEKSGAAAGVLRKLLGFNEPATIQYTLALIDQALAQKPREVGAMFAPGEFVAQLKGSLERLADASGGANRKVNEYIFVKCVRILNHLFTLILQPGDEATANQLKAYLDLIFGDNTVDNMANRIYMDSIQSTVYMALMELLKRPFIRFPLVEDGGITKLDRLLKSQLQEHKTLVQQQYQTINCLWLLSFEKDLTDKLISVIPRVVEAGRNSQKEKVIRITLAFLRNMAEKQSDCVERMIECKLNKQLEVWNNKRWGDEDMVADLKYLSETIEKMIEEMSSFERFRAEVLSGELEWTPVHYSEVFWRDNISKFSQDDYQLIRLLSEMLSSVDTKAVTKAVACYDIGEFVRLHPSGRKIVNQLGTKKAIMSLVYDVTTDPEVQKQALLCTRKMMVTNWEMLK